MASTTRCDAYADASVTPEKTKIRRRSAFLKPLVELSVVLWITLVFSSEISQVSGKGMCVMEGPCDDGFGGDLNCLRRRPAEPIDDEETLEKFRLLCPDLAKDKNPLLCCSVDQIKSMESNFDVPSNMLGRCPSCFENFKKIFCNFACSPDQEDFLNVTMTEKNEEGKNIIKEVTYYISKTFADGAFESCERVKGLTPGNTAIELMCGLHGADCDAEKWLSFMGTSYDNGGVAPFQIDFNLTDESFISDNKQYTPVATPFYKCTEFAGTDMIPCSCVDCLEACSAANRTIPVLPEDEQPRLIMGHDAMNFVTLVVGLVLALLILIIFVFQGFQKVSTYNCDFRSGEENAGTDKEALSRRQVTPGSIAATGVNLGSLEEVEPLRSKRSNGGASSNKVDCKSPTDSVDSEKQAESMGKSPKLNYLPPMQNMSCLESLGTAVERMLENGFQAWGTFVATYPMFVMIPSFLVSVVMCLGLFYFKVTTDPVDLWVSPSSQAKQDMDYFNKHFSPFYRVEQVIVTPTNLDDFQSERTNPEGGNNWGAAFEKNFLLEVEKLHKTVQEITAVRNNRTVRLEDICLQPLSPARNVCVIQSLFIYYDRFNISADKDSYLERFSTCVGNFGNEECFGNYGGPLLPVDVAFGAFETNENGSMYHTAKALVITLPVLNNLDKEDNLDAMAWEKVFIDFMKNYSNPIMSVAFKGERSIEDELERGSHSDIVTIAISYIIMFAYIAIALGDVNQCGTLMIDTKISLGLVGVVIVLISVVASLGIFCFLGVPATLIIVEVIPFLVLAVGVDNIFILVQAYQRDERQPNETMAQHIGRVVGEVAPSMMLSSVSMSCCFFIGALTDMPAVKIFALYAGVALLINFFLQMTCFLALFTFDTRRQENHRWDMCWCVKSPKKKKAPRSNVSLLYKFFKNIYAPFLMKSWVRFVVMMSFLGWVCSSVAVIDKIELGLDQKLSVPEDSYMLKYFDYLTKYLSVGPPVYFVITDGYNYTERKYQNRICGGGGCDENSLVAFTKAMETYSNKTYIATTVSSWLDDYIDYMRSKTCCRKHPGTDNHCPASDPYAECENCLNPPRIPTGEHFEDFIEFFLEDIPDRNCPKAGRAQFKSAIELKNVSGRVQIGATYFMTYHTVLKTSKDFYKALEWSRHVADELTKIIRGNDTNITAKVIPYSLVHVFFEQYLTMWPDTFRSLGYSLAAIFIVTFLLLGLDLFSAFIVVFTILMIIVNLMGMMYWWDISLNAVSLVNLVVAVGISVEFCSHLTRCFTISPEPTRLARAEDALQKMGASILSGITLTDCGILVLVFAKSQIFKVFYFRMYVGIILFGTLHSLIFLPVFLSIFGPPVNKKRMYEHIHLREIRSQERITVNDSNM